MPRFNDTSGVANTCPKIDNVISFLENLEITEHDEGFSIEDIKELCKTMEEIRTANESLREHGSNLQNEIDELTDEKTDLEKKIEEIESDNEYLKNRIEKLQSEIEELEIENSDLRELNIN